MECPAATVNPSMSRQSMRRAWPVVLAVALLATGFAGPPAADAAAAAPPVETDPVATSPAIADDRLVIGLEPGTSAEAALSIAAEVGVRAEAIGSDTLVVDAPGEVSAGQRDELVQDPRVRFVEPNYRLSASAFSPNDALYPAQFSLRDTQPGAIHAPSAWRTTIGSRDIVVGVLDSGVDMDHPDLVGNLWSNRTRIGGCAYGTHGYDALAETCRPEDDNGHGTHVAGILGAVGNNGIGVIGVAPRVSLMPLKMLNAGGSGSIVGAVRAIDWALAAKAAGVDLRVLNASWAGDANSQALAAAVNRAGQAGVLVVAAAGNTIPSRALFPTYPCDAAAPRLVCVGASAPDDGIASFSHYGGQVDVAAPGVGILSTVPPVIGGCGGIYCAYDGTSMAAPMVSGAAVLAVAAQPALTVDALRARVLGAVTPVPALVGKVVTGGRLDVCQVVPGCGGTAQRRPTVPRQVSVEAGPGRATVRWAAPSSNGNAFSITGYVVTGPRGARTLGPADTEVTFYGLADNRNANFYVRATNNIGVSPAAQPVARPFNGGYVVDRTGSLARFALGAGPAPSATSVGPPGAEIKGVALLPDGTGGYRLDGTGRLHPFAVGDNRKPPAVTGGPSWPGQDRARGVAVNVSGTGGYVLDANGGLHRFGIGDQPRPPVVTAGPAWPGWDIARGVALTPSGQGGYVVDGFGGIHRFAVGGSALPAQASNGPFWGFQDLAPRDRPEPRRRRRMGARPGGSAAPVPDPGPHPGPAVGGAVAGARRRPRHRDLSRRTRRRKESARGSGARKSALGTAVGARHGTSPGSLSGCRLAEWGCCRQECMSNADRIP